jgi:hypothetical protein
MHRTEITAAVVDQADRLLTFRLDHATIAKRLGLSEYVVGVIAGDRGRDGRQQPPDRPRRQMPDRPNAMDSSVVRMVQRMLAVGMLNYSQIAREAGVSLNFVAQIARGERPPISTLRPVLSDGEQFVPESARCDGCGRTIYVVPCRACRAEWPSKAYQANKM